MAGSHLERALGTGGAIFVRFIGVVRRHGPLNTLKLLPKNAWEVLSYVRPSRRRARRHLSEFDRRFGVDTARNVEVRDLNMPIEVAAAAARYQPIGSIDAYLRALPIAFEGYTFVDYGCGKGRALLLASEFPFKSIIGVEYASMLVDVALDNIRKYNSASQKCKNLRVFESDATHFQPPSAPSVYFLYNPFGREVLEAVLRQIQRANAGPTHMNYLIYIGPRHRRCLEATSDWIIFADHGNWVVYRTAIPAIDGRASVASDLDARC